MGDYEFYDVNSRVVKPLNPTKEDGCDTEPCAYTYVATNNRFPIKQDDVIEFIVEYNAPVQNDVPTFDFLTVSSIVIDNVEEYKICDIRDEYPLSDSPPAYSLPPRNTPGGDVFDVS